MLSTNAKKAVTSHRRQNSTPTASNPAMYAAFATTNQQRPTHRRGLSTGYPSQSQQHGPTNPDGKVSTNSNALSGQQNMRAAQMPATSRPGQANGFLTQFDSTQVSPRCNQDLTKISEESEAVAKDSQQIQSGVETRNCATVATTAAESAAAPKDRNPAATLLLEFMERFNHFSNTDVKQALQEVGSKMPSNLLHINASEQSESSASMRRGRSWQEPATSTHQEFSPNVPKAPHTVPLRCSATFDVASYPSTTFPEFSDLKCGFGGPLGGYNSSNYSPLTNRSGLSSFQSSPELAPLSLFDACRATASESGMGLSEDFLPSSPPGIHHQRHNSTTHIGEGPNCSDDEAVFRPDDFLIPSNVTDEEINAFIQGPDEAGKYNCLYDNCKNAPFGRKENIRAHVQTHLDDRRYQCDSCRNKFVRPNDLKRHWQIHVNKRDFKCFCGAAFNRHDALKRHRERSEWCESNGTRGSPDSPKKDEKKRGRPKKIAPTESQERRERKALIRREVRKKQEAASAASSVVSMESPPPDFDFNEFSSHAYEGQRLLSPSHTSLTPPASPRDDMDGIFNPQFTASLPNVQNQSLSPPPTRDSMLSFGLNVNNDSLMFADLEPSLPEEIGHLEPDSSPHASPPSLDLESSSPRPVFEFGLNSDQVMLGQGDNDFSSMGQLSEPKGHEVFNKTGDLFSDLMLWADPNFKNSADAFNGMDPGRLDVTLPHNRNSDPLFW